MFYEGQQGIKSNILSQEFFQISPFINFPKKMLFICLSIKHEFSPHLIK
mgnify:CR=1 FL=1